ncbi:hypothetical protein RSAG8_05635, partial [Rhizoctonia solani AG-8 WAC10335]
MESRKRAKQPLEGDENKSKRVKQTIQAWFHSEGSTGSGSPSNTLPRVNPVENEQSLNDSGVDRDTNQSAQPAHLEEEDIPELMDQPTGTHFAMATNQNLSPTQTAEDLAQGSHTPRNPQVDATKRKGLKWLFKTGALGPVTNALGPIKQAAEIFVECVDSYKVAGKAKAEHDELIARLEGLFDDIAGYFGEGCSQPMTASMSRLCKSIQEELELIQDKKGRSAGARYLAANDEAEEILERYRRVEGYLERLSLNANLSMWKLAHVQATDYQSDRMFSLIDRLPSVLPARYNSAEGEALKRRECTPGTRVQEIAQVLGWVRNRGEGAVYWLNGMAGTGKTTISYSVCTALDSGHMLGASFFCSRLREECRNVNKIIPSIAYQLARFSRPFQYALCNALEKNPDAHGGALRMQFDALIKDPILQVEHTLPEELIVVIDALDECDNTDGTRDILDALLSRVADLPIKFIVSSRPEPQIRDQMADERVRFRLVLHELDTGHVQVDMK